ncbi:MAG: response regulator [Pseudomonadota bacterium]
MLDNERKIVSSNQAFLDLFGYKKNEVEGESIRIIHQSDDSFHSFGKTAYPVIKKSGSVMLEWEFIRKDGTIISVETAVSAIKSSDGSITGYVSVLRNITHRKKEEEEKKKLEAQLIQAQKMEAIGTLAGGVAHDFNNLLMAIQGRASIMLMNKDSSHPDFGHLRGIEGHVESAADLTRQLLGFARGGKYEVRPTDLNELIKKENRMFGRTKKEITIHGTYEENLWSVEVDRGQIEQVLLNLYVNAWQAMPGGGDLYLETENVTIDENYVKLFSIEPGRYVKISVTDTGVGMDKATQKRIFDPFFTTKEMGRGTGLGLASAYGIIKNHGGFINVYSEKGHGTTFNVYLPASEKEVIEDKKLAGDTVRGTETVLFVDDEDMIIEVAEQLLEQLGYKVLTARSGKEAIEIYEENKERIDIVILDMIMPDMSGGETYDRMRDINPKVKVLLSSGYSINGQATEILDRGCNGFIQKPFKMKELSQKLREILDAG